MRLLSLMTAAALLAGTGLAGAQATNFSITPGDAKSLSGSGADVRDWRTVEQRRMMERNPRYGAQASWNDPHHSDGGRYDPAYSYRNGWNAYGAGVQIGPVGIGVGPYGVGVGYDAWPHHGYHGSTYHDGRWN